jgi:hypothetical protein
VLLITNIEISGTNVDNFSLGGNPPFPFVVEEDDFYPLKLRFAPDKSGPFEATMMVYSNAETGSKDIRLSGFGATPSLIHLPIGLHFDTTMTTRIAEAEVRIRNTSGVELVVTDIQLAGADPDQFEIEAALPVRIAGEALSPFIVRFTPTTTGFKRAEIVITSDAPSSPDDMVVDGAAILLGTDPVPTAQGFAILALFPQPLHSSTALNVQVATSSSAGEIRLLIYDVLGRMRGLLFEGRLSAGSTTLQLPISHLELPPGMYTLQMENADTRVSRTVIIAQ